MKNKIETIKEWAKQYEKELIALYGFGSF